MGFNDDRNGLKGLGVHFGAYNGFGHEFRWRQSDRVTMGLKLLLGLGSLKERLLQHLFIYFFVIWVWNFGLILALVVTLVLGC